MKDVCVITGGGSGMGLAAAKLIGKTHQVVLVGRTQSKLDNAREELSGLGIEADIFPCDVSDRDRVKQLAAYAQSRGTVQAVINSAGLSPHMDTAQKIFVVNAIGTLNIDEEFAPIMPEGGCILNVGSTAGYFLPADKIPMDAFKLSMSDTKAFESQIISMLDATPPEKSPSQAYIISKTFVIWLSEKMACTFGRKGVRILSVSPGTFHTPMGDLEAESSYPFAESGALGRAGNPEEIARVMEFLISDNSSYITGVDILCDGGTIAGQRTRQQMG